MKYRVEVEFSPEDEGYVATMPELPGCSAYGDTLEDAVRELRVAAEAWLETARDLGRPIPEPDSLRPYSGKLVLRMPPELHRDLDRRATDAGVSLNQYLVYVLARAVGASERRGANSGSGPKRVLEGVNRRHGRAVRRLAK